MNDFFCQHATDMNMPKRSRGPRRHRDRAAIADVIEGRRRAMTGNAGA